MVLLDVLLFMFKLYGALILLMLGIGFIGVVIVALFSNEN